jgi:COP9 signalosome complex subunit 7
VGGVAQKLAYDDLLAALQLQTVRDLEDFVIDAVYSELIVGKLDQMGQVFTVSWVTARDVRREDLGAVLDKLTRWRERCTTTKTILQKSSR